MWCPVTPLLLPSGTDRDPCLEFGRELREVRVGRRCIDRKRDKRQENKGGDRVEKGK